MNARFRFTQEAEAQLAEIIDYIASDSEDAARRLRTGSIILGDGAIAVPASVGPIQQIQALLARRAGRARREGRFRRRFGSGPTSLWGRATPC